MKIIKDLQKIEQIKSLKKSDRSFIESVYSKNQKIYKDRLRSIDFQNKDSILDFGSGYGQWSLSMSELNNKVYSLEVSTKRLEISKLIFDSMGKNNIVSINSIDTINHKLDAIFSYSVLQCLDFKQKLQDFFNWLKPNGVLYFTAADIGWYLYNLDKRDETLDTYDKFAFVSNSLKSSLKYYEGGEFIQAPLNELIMPKEIVFDTLKDIGFNNIKFSADGKLNLVPGYDVQSFYPEFYKGIPSIYEVYCEK